MRRPNRGPLASVLLLAALLPTLLAPDHWRPTPGSDPAAEPAVHAGHHHTYAPSPAPGPEPAGSRQHQAHCHGAPASCSDAPLTALTGFALLAAVAAFGGGPLVRRLRADGCRRLSEAAVTVPLRPPRPSLLASPSTNIS